jgi:hypothetical protein
MSPPTTELEAVTPPEAVQFCMIPVLFWYPINPPTLLIPFTVAVEEQEETEVVPVV